ncbi:MAG: hypothetical protein AB1758_00410 [Candidatus Eremiobacterota bacterium]
MKNLATAIALSLSLAAGAAAQPAMEQTVTGHAEDLKNVVTVLDDEWNEEFSAPMVLYPHHGYYRFDLCPNERLEVEVVSGDSTRYQLELIRGETEDVWQRVVAESPKGAQTLNYSDKHPQGMYYLRLIPSSGAGGPFTLRYKTTDPD